MKDKKVTINDILAQDDIATIINELIKEQENIDTIVILMGTKDEHLKFMTSGSKEDLIYILELAKLGLLNEDLKESR